MARKTRKEICSEISSNDYIKEREEMTAEDEFIVIKNTYLRLNKIKKTNPEFYEEIRDKIGIELRITKIEINEKTTEYLISNLAQNEFCMEELKEIYEKRWQIDHIIA